MTAPRQPRMFREGDNEPPAGVDNLVDSEGYPARRYGDYWTYADSDEWFPWVDLDDEFDISWPLVEVPPDTPAPPLWPLDWTVPDHVEVGAFGEDQVQIRCKLGGHEVHERTVLKTFETDNRIGYFLKEHAHGESVERLAVLPETPEPPKAPGDLKPGDRVADATDDVDNPLRMVGTILRSYVPGEDEEPGYVVQWDGMPEPMDEVATELTPLHTPQSSPTPVLPLSAPVETEGEVEGVSEALSPQSETELKLWNLLDKAEEEYDASDEPCDRKSALVRAVLAEGWRPPLPACPECTPTATETHWGHGVAHISIEPEDEPPLPADEVEWGYGWPEFGTFGSTCQTEADARFMTTQDPPATVVQRRKAGEWVAVPVEPKETK